ncbi:MAG: 16S rRNA (guanine966-N2)-methyltransferase [Flavobacteriales bacterium]
MSSPSKHSRGKPQSSLRIIGGTWRSRRLPIIEADGLRPSADRIRETLFNWLQADVRGARCLDLFAGTGALGLEALSRGASFVQFNELNPKVERQLSANLQLLTLDPSRAKSHCQNSVQWLDQSTDKPYDIVFIDPPFAAKLWDESFKVLEHRKLLADRALIYVESPRDTKLQLPENWEILREKSSGSLSYRLCCAN